MALANYGVLLGKIVDHGIQHGGNPHYLLMVEAGAITYRVAINTGEPKATGGTDLLFEWKPDLDGKAASSLLKAVRAGERKNGPLPGFWLAADGAPTLDFVRGNLVEAKDIDDPESPLKKLADAAGKAKSVIVFGTGYPERDYRTNPHYGGLAANDPRRASFGFTGVDNVHMNQGSPLKIGNHLDRHFDENGPSQDGAVLFCLADDKVAGFFARFATQATETDAFGNPVHTGVAELDATPEAARRAVLSPNRYAHLAGMKAAPGSAAAARPLGAAASRNERDLAAQPGDLTPGTRNAVNSATVKRIFADPAPVDPSHVFRPDIDDDVYNSPDSQKYGKYGVPEPVPGTRGGVYPVMKLDAVIDTGAIEAAGQISFHAVGDTGAPKAPKLPNETKVADMMVAQLSEDGPSTPSFFFHLGDVVYFYGEQEYYYDQFAEPYKDYDRPIFAIPGNHDGITYSDDMVSLEAFIAAFCAATPGAWAGFGGISRTTMDQPGVYFTLDAPFVSIIGLYSNCSESYGFLDDQQKLFLLHELKRLKKLKESDPRAVIIAVHHPPLSASSKKPSSATMRDDMDKACNEAGFWPDAVFSGHAHLYQRITRTVTVDGEDRQIPYIVCGAGGYDVSQSEVKSVKKSFVQKDVSDPHFILHRLVPRYGFMRVTVTGATKDSAGTLRTEYWAPDLGDDQPADVCVVDLGTHAIV